uniref:Uncharacterized protein n=1 Tax=Brugia malayi TaxID=6279 RepID=A8Q281_BRUMA
MTLHGMTVAMSTSQLVSISLITSIWIQFLVHIRFEDTNNVESTTERAENSQLLLQELSGISAENFQSGTSLDSLHFFDSIQLRRIKDANTEESKMKIDFATVQNSQLSLLQDPSIPGTTKFFLLIYIQVFNMYVFNSV